MSVDCEGMLAVGLTYRQLDHWTTTGYLLAERTHGGTGRHRRWSYAERDVAAIMARLVAVGIPPAVAHKVARGLELAPGIRIIVDPVT